MSAEATQPANVFDVIAAQPGSLAGLNSTDRAALVVSVIVDDSGALRVVSRFGDPVWDLRSMIEADNSPESEQMIRWPLDIPTALVDAMKASIYCWMRHGRSGYRRAGPSIARRTVVSGNPFLRWIAGLGIESLDRLQQLHVSNYIHECKQVLKLGPDAVRDRLLLLDVMWAFRSEAGVPLAFYPWGKSSINKIAGTKGLGLANVGPRAGRTPIIPADVRASLFRHAESVVESAAALLDARDRGELSPWDERLLEIRDACLFLVSITSGMRNEEVTGIENDSWRQERKGGVTYTWVRSVERKIGKGPVEYLVPPELVRVLATVQRFAQPYQARLAAEIARLEAGANDDGIDRLQRLRRCKRSLKKLFLCEHAASGTDGTCDRETRIDVLARNGCTRALKRLVQTIGSDWDIATHQCRRTYARMFVESRMGRSSLIFLKWQFKHAIMSMTELYGANPLQDSSLYDEILDELAELKAELVDSWLDGKPLSGGAGRQIIRLRAIPIKDREEMVRRTAESIHIRATGHSWCLAQLRGCGGAGLYEATRCEGCKDGVIDDTFVSIWEGIHAQQVELQSLTDAGPAVVQRAERDAFRSLRVLEELGVPIPALAA